ncbi:MAG: apolipoprotein N-acyltransferase [Arachnia sp.]
MHPLTRRPLSTPTSLGVAVLAGLMIGLGYAPIGWWPITIAGVGLFTWLMSGMGWKRSAVLGLVAGVSLNALMISWISVLGAFVAIALVAFMSLWMGVLGMFTASLTRLGAWPFLVPAAWVGVELAMGTVPFGGFPWLRLAFTALDQPLSGWFSIIGAVGVSYLVALAACGLTLAATRIRGRGWIAPVTGTVAFFVAGGLLQLVPVATPEQTVTVGMVQGGVNRAEHGTASYASSVTNNMLSETVFLVAEARVENQPAFDFVVWPENSTDVDPINDARTKGLIETAASLVQAPIFVGAVTDGPLPDTRQTTGMWWDPVTGPGDTYEKRNLVPFGEWIPFREVLLPRVPILEQVGRQSIPGTGPGVVAAPTERYQHLVVGDVICFELAWDATVYDTVRAGADLLVSQSNTNTYIGTFESPQQLAINRVRAMELGREFVASTLNGQSGLIDVHGTVHEPTREFTAASRTYSLGLRYNTNLPVRLGAWPSYVLSLTAVAGMVYATARRRSETR